MLNTQGVKLLPKQPQLYLRLPFNSKRKMPLIPPKEEIYDFADKYRDDYVKALSNAQGFYNMYSGFIVNLAWVRLD